MSIECLPCASYYVSSVPYIAVLRASLMAFFTRILFVIYFLLSNYNYTYSYEVQSDVMLYVYSVE